MTTNIWPCAALSLIGVFLSTISQVMLKKAALKNHAVWWREYINPLVIIAYIIFVGTTFLGVLAYRGIPLSLGPVLEATGYMYITLFGVVIFKEKFHFKKAIALGLILCGIVLYAFG